MKRQIHMGLAKIDPAACLPLRKDKLRQDCDLCCAECRQAGYHAIEMQEIRPLCLATNGATRAPTVGAAYSHGYDASV